MSAPARSCQLPVVRLRMCARRLTPAIDGVSQNVLLMATTSYDLRQRPTLIPERLNLFYNRQINSFVLPAAATNESSRSVCEVASYQRAFIRSTRSAHYHREGPRTGIAWSQPDGFGMELRMQGRRTAMMNSTRGRLGGNSTAGMTRRQRAPPATKHAVFTERHVVAGMRRSNRRQ